jgi:hypothetical protein
MSIRTYQEVADRFNKTKKPPRSKKYNEAQRPLRRVSESHLMLQKDAHSFVYIINGVEVARFFEPNEQGEYEVAVRGLYNTNDINLMWRFTGLFNGMNLLTTLGDMVKVPLNHRYRDQDKEFSAFLTFNSSDQLVVEKSWHADIYRLESTADDKQKRKDIKTELDAYVTLQLFKLPTLKENCKPDASMGRPFGESNLHYAVQQSMTSALRSLPLPLESQSFMDSFDKVAQDCFDMLVSKKVYNRDGDGNLFYKIRGYYGGNNPSDKADAQEQIDDIADAITPEEFKKSLTARLMGFAGLSKGTRSVALPQFANALPRTYYTVANT